MCIRDSARRPSGHERNAVRWTDEVASTDHPVRRGRPPSPLHRRLRAATTTILPPRLRALSRILPPKASIAPLSPLLPVEHWDIEAALDPFVATYICIGDPRSAAHSALHRAGRSINGTAPDADLAGVRSRASSASPASSGVFSALLPCRRARLLLSTAVREPAPLVVLEIEVEPRISGARCRARFQERLRGAIRRHGGRPTSRACTRWAPTHTSSVIPSVNMGMAGQEFVRREHSANL